jgi:tetratricopeptide (TPR) repeat protein
MSAPPNDQPPPTVVVPALAGQDAADVRSRKLSLLDRAEAVAGLSPSRALWEDRALYLERLGEAVEAGQARARAARIEPASARDRYLLAISFARKRRYADAVADLDAALRLNPDHYWSLLQRGLCHRERGELLLAANDFSRCAGLEPSFAWGHYNLGCVLDQAGKREEAIAAYTAALRCDAGFALARLNRGLAELELGRSAAALADLDEAVRLGRDDALLHLGRGAALESLGKPREADTAFGLALDKAQDLPPARRTPVLLGYGFAVYRRLPDAAEGAFAQVLRQEAHHPQALYGRAMVLTEAGKEDEAIACFDEALSFRPSFVEARRCRAVLLARRGRLAAAREDVDRCLQQDPHSGATLYACACARASEKAPPGERRRLEDRAVALLEGAFRRGGGRAGAAADPDLRAILHRHDAQALLRQRSPREPIR